MSTWTRLLTTAAAVGLFACALNPAVAADLRMGRASAFSSTAFSDSTLTIGYFTPAYGAMTLGVSPTEPLMAHSFSGMTSSLAPTFDIGGSDTTPVSVGRVGVFGAYDERPSILALTPTTAWNFGASVGYAGFYVRGGVNEATPMGPLMGTQGLEAGFGYELGAFDLRLTYLASQSVGLAEHEIDSKQWAVGGIYQITPRIRVNADAFYGVGENSRAALAVQPPMTSPPGTGARVGVQLRF